MMALPRRGSFWSMGTWKTRLGSGALDRGLASLPAPGLIVLSNLNEVLMGSEHTARGRFGSMMSADSAGDQERFKRATAVLLRMYAPPGRPPSSSSSS